MAEIVYLTEKGRFQANAYKYLKSALADSDHAFKEAVLTSDIVDAMHQVPRGEVPVNSRDGRIRSSNVPIIW